MSSSTEGACLEEDRRVCRECLEDEFLRAEIERNGCDGTCFYCEMQGETISIDRVADLVATALSQHFYPVSTERPDDVSDTEEIPGDVTDEPAGPSAPGLPLTEIIIRSAGISEAVAKDIVRVLKEQSRDDGQEGPTGVCGPSIDDRSLYARMGSDDYDDGTLRRFAGSVATETRFFNRAAEEILTSMFWAIDVHRTVNARPVVVEAGPGTELIAFYRARVFQDEPGVRGAMKRPDLDVGPPPSDNAAAGRLNAAGIAVFYGATDPDVALAEVQPPVGSKVLIGRFEVVSLLRLLDMEALEQVEGGKGSIFDPDYIERLRRAAFLRGLSRDIARPVMPSDRVRGYLPTQAVADFLAAMDPPLDGIVYPSVQAGRPCSPIRWLGARKDKRNVVLFRKTARVQALAPDDAIIEVHTDSWIDNISLFGDSVIMDNAPDLTYTVYEKSVRCAPPPELCDAPLKLTDLEVRYVRSVTFETQAFHVRRIRFHNPVPGA